MINLLEATGRQRRKTALVESERIDINASRVLEGMASGFYCIFILVTPRLHHTSPPARAFRPNRLLMSTITIVRSIAGHSDRVPHLSEVADQEREEGRSLM